MSLLSFETGADYSFGPASRSLLNRLTGDSPFLNSVSRNVSENPHAKDGKGYQCTGYTPDDHSDKIARRRARQNFIEDYNLFDYNCRNFVDDTLKGLPLGDRGDRKFK